MRFWPDPLPSPPKADLGLEFPPAGNHYRALVSDPSQYDILAAIQFEFLCRLGLREHHSLLDIGCGSVRGGRLFIPYLLPGKYCGIEPELWPIEAGIERELGESILQTKAPSFLIDDEFTCSAFQRTFDFILAHSIFSHASLDQVRRCMAEVRRCMTDDSVFAATYVRGTSNNTLQAWKAPGVVTYTEERIQTLAEEQGLRCIEYELHPFGQKWILMTLPTKRIKPRVHAIALDPAGSASVGDKVKVTISAEAYGSNLESVQFFVNTTPDDEQWTSAAWEQVSLQTLDSPRATVGFVWDTSGRQPGRHRLGVNVTAQDETLWWYDQPHLTYDLKN